MQFSLSDTAGQKVDAETGLPVKDNTIFWKNLWNIIKWVGIILAVVVVLFFLLVVSVRVRHFLYRKKRKNRRVKYPVTAGTQITQRQGPVHIYVQPDTLDRRPHQTSGVRYAEKQAIARIGWSYEDVFDWRKRCGAAAGQIFDQSGTASAAAAFV